MADREVISTPLLITAPQWRQIVNSATDTAIITTDPDGKVTSWNEGARRLLGWQELEMLGQSLERLFTDEDLQNGTLARAWRRSWTSWLR